MAFLDKKLIKKEERKMFSWLRTVVGRKLIALILTPVLSGLLIALNAFLPEGAKLSPEQITHIIEWIIGLAASFIVAQGAADAVHGSPGNPKVKPADSVDISS
jgi:hypothetical protein